jgi:hypothetical protein
MRFKAHSASSRRRGSSRGRFQRVAGRTRLPADAAERTGAQMRT